MKKVLSLLVLSAIVCLSVSACGTPSAIRRGSWNNLVYFNEYGEFNLRSNELFERYTDRKIKKNLGFVYSKDGRVLNDLVISSDYCAIIVTLENPGEEYSLKEYVDAFILNSRQNNAGSNYSISECYQQSIAGKTYTCVPILYYETGNKGSIGYCEYTYIYKSLDNVFVLIRITSGTQLNIEIALKMFEDPNAGEAGPSSKTSGD